MRARSGRRVRTAALAALTLTLAALVAACDSSASSSPTPSSSDTASSSALPQLPPETLTFGVIGSAGEIEQYRTMAETFAPVDRKVIVAVEGWPNDATMLASFRAGQRIPDVFLVTRRWLGYLQQRQLIQPVDQLLDDRGFDFGDEYPRSSLQAFGSDNRLECLPYGVQPEVIFYNKRLVRFSVLRNGPTPGQGWSIDQFLVAARYAVNHHPDAAGIYLQPDLTGIAPFVYSGGGKLYDDDTKPTSLALSDSTNTAALVQTLRALHAPTWTLSQTQLTEHTPLEWFAQGRLALLEGSRRMVPDLRAAGVNFDVMPMPTLSTSATVGSLSGMCLSATARDVGTAADFLAYANAPGALALVSYGGYLQPANQTVALSDAFQQPDQLPRHASAFTFSVKSMVYPPVPDRSDDLDALVDPMLEQLLQSPAADVPKLTRRIDRASYRILGPTYGPSASPSS